MLRCLFLFLVLSFSNALLALSYTVEMTETELQNRLNEKLPYKKNYDLFNAVFSNSKVKLIGENNLLNISSDVSILALDFYQSRGTISIKSELTFRPKEGAFYLKEPMINELAITNMPKEILVEVKRLLQEALVYKASQIPVYKLKDTSAWEKMASALLKSVEIKEKKVLATLSVF